MNRLVSLEGHGQAIWLDFLARDFLARGDLQRLVAEDGLTGVTSNPSIFEAAIAHGVDYDASLKQAEQVRDRDAMALYEQLAIDDIRQAADALRPVYEVTQRADGYVSLEVSPYLARNTEATVSEARRLWLAVDRPNVMIKIPATPAGLPAIRQLIGEGININITLLFSQEVYEDVAEAYIGGLERLAAVGGDPARVASVASFFVSRLDVAVEKLIQQRNGRAGGLSDLNGKVAIANAKLAYRRYQRLFSGPRWQALEALGARPQRLLWASTGRKNPAYSDVLYVEEMIAPDTVNTMPPSTLDAFRDHGAVRASLVENMGEAAQVMAALERGGISIDGVAAMLVEEGVRSFAESFDTLLGAIARKRAALLGPALDSQSWTLPKSLEADVVSALDAWQRVGSTRRLWAKDASLWTGADEALWLGWLDAVKMQQKQIGRLEALAESIRRRGFTHILLLGMDGSSLGAQVIAETFGPRTAYPKLLVLDSTDPEQIRSFESRIDLSRTLFIVSSKSGKTLESTVLRQYFFERMKALVGAENVGSHFVAITDRGSPLHAIAVRDGFALVAFGEASIGGRYSVLSNFGMAPAALMGLDIGKFLATTQIMVHSCAACVPAADNPGVVLGATMAVLAKAGRNKVTIVASPGIADIGAWLEQLLAESTGKQGKGLIPVVDEPLGAPSVYGHDRLFVYLRLSSGVDPYQDESMIALERDGQPLVRITVTDRYHLGQEFFRWQIATAVAAAIIGVNPFDQPDVEASLIKARAITRTEGAGVPSAEEPLISEDGLQLFTDTVNARELALAGGDSLAGWLRAHLARLEAGDYYAILAYVDDNDLHRERLQKIRLMIRDRQKVATSLGFGPRFLHATGQAFKGGSNTGVFLQITCDHAIDVDVPGEGYSFGFIKAVEARGDFDVLAERKRRLLRVHLGTHVAAGLSRLEEAIRQALA